MALSRGRQPTEAFPERPKPRSGDIGLALNPLSPLRGLMGLSRTIPWVSPTAKRRGHCVANYLR